MDKLNGYKTIITMGIALGVAVLSQFDIAIDLDTQANIGIGITALTAVVLRFMTKGPIGGKKE